jgi:uncharacterized protein (DUF58 family)
MARRAITSLWPLGAGLRSRLHYLIVRRSLRLTSEGSGFLLFTLGIGVAALNTGNNLFYLLLAMMLSLVVISGLLSEQCLRCLHFHRHLPDLIVADQPTTITILVTNRSRWLPSFSLRIFDVSEGHDLDRGLFVAQVPPQRSALLSYPILASTRGRLRLDGIRVDTLFPFGLFLKRALYQVPAEILVSPSMRPLSLRFVDELVNEGQGLSLARRGHGMQLYNLRLYRPGDDSRAIHWMTTARTSTLIVRETEAEDQRRMTIVLSTVAPDEHNQLFERSLMLIASLLWQLSQHSYPLRLIVNTEDSGLGSGLDHLATMLRLLALCERRAPKAGDSGLPGPLSLPGHDTDLGYTVMVMPWTEGGLSLSLTPDRILDAAHIEALTHGF